MKNLLFVLFSAALACGQVVGVPPDFQGMSITGGMKVTGGLAITNPSAVLPPVQADFFVSALGSDTNDGTAPALGGGHGPFATAAAAQTAVRGIKNTKAITVMIRCDGGPIYNTSLSFTSADNPDNNTTHVITWTAYPLDTGCQPSLSAGVRQTGWTHVTTGSNLCTGHANCWQKTLPNTTPYFEDLWYNGQRRLRPGMGATAASLVPTWGHVQSGNAGNTGFTYTAGDPVSASWTSCNLAAVHDCEFLHSAAWTMSIERIASITTGSTNITSTCSGSNCPNAGSGEFHNGWRYTVTNVKELLQFPGTWYLDRTAGGSNWTLTYIALNAIEDPNADVVETGKNAQVINAVGLQNTIFSNLMFMHSLLAIPATGYASKQLEPDLPAAMVSCSGCHFVILQDNFFAHTAANAVEFIKASTQNNYQFNNSWDIGGAALLIGAKPDSQNDTDANVPSSNLVTENGFSTVGLNYPAAGDCIILGLTHGNTITNNDCGWTYHGGIEACLPSQGVCTGVSGGGLANNIIMGNHIRNFMQGITSDGGGIYMMDALTGCQAGANGLWDTGTDAVGNQIVGNLIHDGSDSTADGDSTHAKNANGIYLDQCSGKILVQNNILYRVAGVGLRMTNGPRTPGNPNTFTNNIVRSALMGVMGVQDCAAAGVQQFVFDHNLIDITQSSTLMGFGAEYLPGTPTAEQNWHHNSYHRSTGTLANQNNFWNHDSNCAGISSSGSVAFASFAAWKTFGEDASSVVDVAFGFGNLTPCSGALDPIAGSCDDLTSVYAGAGFTPIPMFDATGQLLFGRSVDNALPLVPPCRLSLPGECVQDTLKTGTYALSAF